MPGFNRKVFKLLARNIELHDDLLDSLAAESHAESESAAKIILRTGTEAYRK